MPPLCLSLLNSPGAASPAVLAPSLSSSSSLEVAARRGAAADVETSSLLSVSGNREDTYAGFREHSLPELLITLIQTGYGHKIPVI